MFMDVNMAHSIPGTDQEVRLLTILCKNSPSVTHNNRYYSFAENVTIPEP